MRVVFMGTPDFAVPTLDAIVQAGHQVIAVVAQPDKPKGRGKKLVSPDTIVRARQLGLETKQPRAINRGPFRDWWTAADFDVAVVIAYGRILKPWHLCVPKRGCINVHASLLPAYRGAAPIHWAVVKGDTRTGVCTMLMDQGLDTGDVLLRHQTAIGPDETTGQLWQRLAVDGAALLTRTLRELDDIVPQPQDHALATLAPLLTKADGQVDWTGDAAVLHDRVRGMNPWPGAWTTFRGDTFKLWNTRCVDHQLPHASATPGTVVHTGSQLLVVCGTGVVEIVEAQLPGKRRQPGPVLNNGARIQVGERFGERFGA